MVPIFTPNVSNNGIHIQPVMIALSVYDCIVHDYATLYQMANEQKLQL